VCVTCFKQDADARETDPLKFPQIGVWFGPVAPLASTRKSVDTVIGGGVFARVNLWQSPFKLGIDGSYQKYDSKSINQITMYPVYGSLLYRLPISTMLAFQLKAGAGGAYIKAYPVNVQQWDPLFVAGGELFFPLGSMAAIGLRVDYLMVYEKRIPGAQRNGHFLNVGLFVNLNLDLFGR